MKALLLAIILAVAAANAHARSRILAPGVRTLQVVANQDWLSPPVIELNSGDVVNISFDEMSHNYHRYAYTLQHCQPDWTPTEGLFTTDYQEGFERNYINDYQNSINTTVMYTHYTLQIPNDDVRLKMSGNYILTVYDEDNGGEKVLQAEFMVTEQTMVLGLAATTNTDISHNTCHQQLSMTLDYGPLSVTNIEEQLRTVVTMNQRTDIARRDVKPNIVNARGLQWTHNRSLIFNGGNEYRKYEILSLSHTTMGIDKISWDGHHYNAYPFTAEPRRNYIYDEDANGAFYIRNSDNTENDYTCDYVLVHYCLLSPEIANASLTIDGQWTIDPNETYTMEYDHGTNAYHATILQKQGYYSYQIVQQNPDGTTSIPPTEGNFFQTENRYQAYVYYKPTGARAWRLAAYRQLIFDTGEY